MKFTWFEHGACSGEEATELLERYRKRGTIAEKYLTSDCRKFIVRALLPEYSREPRQERTYQQRMWG